VSSRKEEKEQRRAERMAREQQDVEQARRKRLYSIVVGGVLATAAIVAVVIAVAAGGGGDGGGGHAGGVPAGDSSYEGATDPPPQELTDLVQAARAADCRLSNPVIEGRTQVTNEEVEYKTNPPTSGNHDPQPAADGVYDEAVTAKDLMHLVHTLEHGRIEFQYDPSLPQRDRDRLGGLFNEDPYHVALFPNRGMPYEVAATAWGHLIGCKQLTDEAFDGLRAFRDRYRDQGPEQVP